MINKVALNDAETKFLESLLLTISSARRVNNPYPLDGTRIDATQRERARNILRKVQRGGRRKLNHSAEPEPLPVLEDD